MDKKHSPLDLPVSESKDVGEGRVIYSFKKDEHAKLLLRNLAEMQANEGMLTDVIVRTKSKDRKDPFHSMLLAACSSVIKQGLTGKHFDCTAGSISLEDVTPNQLEAFRNFLYKSELPLDEEKMDGLRRFANRYGIDSLGKLCGQRRDHGKSDEEMCVWSKHYEDLLSQLYDMFQKTELSTTLLEDSEGSTQFAVHGPLIAAVSPVLQDMLSNGLFAQEGNKYRLKEVSSNTLMDLIEYIYTGAVTLEGENVEGLLNAACSFEIPALTRACCDWLSLQLNSFNAIGIWWLARNANCEYTSHLQEEAKSYIIANFTTICKEAEFLELEYEELKEIIQEDNLCVEGEEDVFSAVVYWVEMDEEGRSPYFCDLLQCVRLECTSLEFLRNVEEDPLVRNCERCRTAVQSAQARLSAQASTELRAFDGVEHGDIQHGNIPDFVPQRYDDEDVKRRLLDEFLNSQSQMHDERLTEVAEKSPRKGQRKSGEPDMRFSINRRRLGQQNKDGSPDMRFKVNKEAKSKSQKGGPTSQDVKGPLKKDGTPDRRFKVNKETSRRSSAQKSTKSSLNESVPVKKDGTPDMRYAVNKGATTKTPSPDSASRPVKQDGTPDMRYTVNKTAAASMRSSGGAARPVKRDGTPDMRFAVNKQSPSSQSSQSSSSVAWPSSYAGPVKKDGTPDMRYASNKQSGSPYPSSCHGSTSQLSSYSTSSGPLKRDGTPDMRYSVNKSPAGSPFSSGYSSGGSTSYSGGSVFGSGSYGPLKSDGTPDMRYASNRSAYGSSSLYGGSRYSSSLSSSGSSYGGSSCSGPLKSDGTPDMRYAANRRK